eukprot:XP_012826165.2 PREDICTED: olfactory receptor 8G1-like [Xenopus tropicalis]
MSKDMCQLRLVNPGITTNLDEIHEWRQYQSEMENQTIVYVLVLAGLSDLPSLQLPLFLVFLLIYLMTLTGNLLILLLIFTDSHLHTPMYFFLGTLACMDLCSSSVTVPRMLFDLLTDTGFISLPACITQFYFFIFFALSEVSVLAVMSYDRYIAICRPLHYMQIMSWKVCVDLVLIVFVSSAAYSSVHTLFLAKLTFCRPDALQSFFCDLPQLLEVSCSDTFINVLLIFLLGIMFGLGILTSEEPGAQNITKKNFTKTGNKKTTVTKNLSYKKCDSESSYNTQKNETIGGHLRPRSEVEGKQVPHSDCGVEN